MNHKSTGCLVGVFVFLATLVAGTIIYWKFAYYRVWLSSTSPNQKYTVELTGDKGRGGILYAVVKYNIFIDKQLVTSNRLLHYGDAMDISFEIAYPEHAWIDDHTLRFWSNQHPIRGSSDTLLITNNTNKVIRFLRVRTWDLFFVFDVQPRSRTWLSFSHRSEGKGISVEGEFEDGSSIDRSVSFLENGSREGLGYCMTIEDQAVRINSPRERAYDGHWNNLNIPVAPECAPNR